MGEKKQIGTLEFETYMDFIAESVERMSPETIFEEEWGSPAEKNLRAEGIRQVLLGQVYSYKRELISKALVDYETQKQKIEKHKIFLPETPEGRRELLQSILSRSKDLSPHLTLQHRDFRTLSDEDVESLLKQLDALGAIK